MLIDSHCHLNHDLLQGDVEGALQRSRQAGVHRVIVVGFDLPSSERAIQLSAQYLDVFAAVAVHPHDAHSYDDLSDRRLREMAALPKVVAIGEIGLDYHYDLSPREAQAQAFRRQLVLASDFDLPVIIHCRDAYADVLDVLEEFRSAKPEGNSSFEGATLGLRSTRSNPGVMHCWAGTMEEASRALTLGYYLGFGGVLTFKNAEETRRIASMVPLDRVLLETDAPYLAPIPYRGKRNEPAYTRLVAAKLAEVRDLSEQAVEDATTANCLCLFSRMNAVIHDQTSSLIGS